MSEGNYGLKEKHGRRKKERKKMNKFLKFILIFLLIIIVIFAGIVTAAWIFYNGKLNMIKREYIDETQIGLSQETEEELSDYRNIALFGIDSRKDDYGVGNRSDCIMVASINKKTNEVKLFSVYRDTYLLVTESGNDVLDKVTHAYSYGTAQNALKSLNTSLDLNIKEYVTVNFDALVTAIDAIGGVKINVDKEEVKYINGYIDETARVAGVKANHITSAGTYNLDGAQAVAYSRIRYTAGGDYKRAERQREVLEAMLTKAKSLGLSQLNALVDEVLPRASTNMSNSAINDIVFNVMNYKIGESKGWPYAVTGYTTDRWVAVPLTLESNVKRLHEEYFNQKDYEVSDTVKEISNKIIARTGLSEDKAYNED
jgi:LCP family protein required for cell wall assembly